MCVQTIKTDENGAPDRAKSRIVVLGNLEDRLWEKSDRYAPVLQYSSLRLLTSMAVEKRRKLLHQGDFKNAFVQASLPDDEMTIVRPPIGDPDSDLDEFWLLQRSLYGLRRAPKHWCTMEIAEECILEQNRPPFPILASVKAVDPTMTDDFGLESLPMVLFACFWPLFAVSRIDRFSIIEAKIDSHRGIDGLGGCQNRNRRSILVWNTLLHYLHGAPPANIGHRQMVQFSVLCRVGFWLARRRRPLASATLAYYYSMSSSLFNASRPSKTRRIWIPFTSRATDGSTLVLACSLTYIGPLTWLMGGDFSQARGPQARAPAGHLGLARPL
ncbi:hypothetical protein THAOC_09816 [Thalassiosira oceanica]|uniref:Reverse transcriptase Ty1/copia-type domain-containing protein n=1 Tax=Thalassiosira oceanica TaxID=159749 RepID=K0T6L4_THAOC|nr:hypothetical protein THAOC_09816 [Thalassiosira oceanica]|eukprot:EJK68971.1 hypothetical protein THAOC_09816 [Thalassiosira oceanica]